jgi:hypothetical protein
LGVFGALIWIEEVPMELFRVELLFYKQIAMPNEAFNPLNWWWNRNTNSQILVFLHIRWWDCVVIDWNIKDLEHGWDHHKFEVLSSWNQESKQVNPNHEKLNRWL